MKIEYIKIRVGETNLHPLYTGYKGMEREKYDNINLRKKVYDYDSDTFTDVKIHKLFTATIYDDDKDIELYDEYNNRITLIDEFEFPEFDFYRIEYKDYEGYEWSEQIFVEREYQLTSYQAADKVHEIERTVKEEYGLGFQWYGDCYNDSIQSLKNLLECINYTFSYCEICNDIYREFVNIAESIEE